MGSKRTIYLTREEAEYKYVSLKEEKMQRMLKAEAILLNNIELEDVLELMNDKQNNGEGFENYQIQEA